MAEHEDRIRALEARVAELTAALERLGGATAAPPAPPAAADPGPDRAPSRRALLRAAGAAAGAAAVGAALARPAAAATGDPITAGQITIANTGNVTQLGGVLLVSASSGSASDALNGFAGTVVGLDPTYTGGQTVRAGVLGAATQLLAPSSAQVAHGVVGAVTSANGSGSGVYGVSSSGTVGSSAGVRARSAKGPALWLEPTLPGAPTAGSWPRGALFADTAGVLWYCRTGGTPGTWVALSTGLYRPVTPARVYDSRLAAYPTSGRLAVGANRTVSVADARDLAGALTAANLVPAGATAVTANVTVVDTAGAGYLCVNPGGTTTVGSSTVNWSASGQILNNGVTLTIAPDRTVTIVAGGTAGSSTEVTIDVTGYVV